MRKLDKETVLGLIEKHFPYIAKKDMVFLFAEFQDLQAFFVIILQLPDFRIRFTWDRADFTMQVGTNQAPLDRSNNGWYELSTIILYFTQKQFLIWSDWHNREFDTDKQLERLSKVFHYYYYQMVELFKQDVLLREEENLNLVIRFTSLLFDRPDDLKSLMEQSRKYWEEIMKY
jgi:hypothetical protein